MFFYLTTEGIYEQRFRIEVIHVVIPYKYTIEIDGHKVDVMVYFYINPFLLKIQKGKV